MAGWSGVKNRVPSAGRFDSLDLLQVMDQYADDTDAGISIPYQDRKSVV